MSRTKQDIHVKNKPRQQIASIRFQMQQRVELQPAIQSLLLECGELAQGDPFVLYHLDSGLPGTDAEICVGVSRPVERNSVHTRWLAPGIVLSCRHREAVNKLPDTYSELVIWAAEHAINLENLRCEVFRDFSVDEVVKPDIEVQFYFIDWETRLAESIDQNLGREARKAVMAGHDGIGPCSIADERARWIHTAVATLDRLTDDEQTFNILSRCAHTFSARRIATLREIYSRSGNVDTVLEAMAREPDWYENPERAGNIIYVTKIPANPARHADAITSTEKHESYCHCAIAYAHTDTMPAAFCYCGAGWYRQLWEGILGQPVQVRIIKALTLQDEVCRFAIYLPENILLQTK